MVFRWPVPDAWEFELVGFLALLGDSSVREVMYPLTAWPFVWLPRLIPAPHALILPRRRITLPSNPNGRVVGVYSGNVLDHLPYFADTLYPIDEMESHTVTEISMEVDFQAFTRFKVNHVSWLNAITVGSCMLTFALLAIAIYLQDAAAIAAISSLAVSGSLMSLAAQWSVKSPPQVDAQNLPDGQIVIYCTQGAFVVIKCNEETARALYLHDSHGCEYLVKPPLYQILVGLGTILLLSGVVFIKNCTRDMQLALGATYVTLNVAYTIVALSRDAAHKHSWNDEHIHHNKDATSRKYEKYTRTLYKAIEVTESSDWVRRIPIAAPNTKQWNDLLRKMDEEAAAARGKPQFNPHRTLSDMYKYESEGGLRQRVIAETLEEGIAPLGGPSEISGNTSGSDTVDRAKAD